VGRRDSRARHGAIGTGGNSSGSIHRVSFRSSSCTTSSNLYSSPSSVLLTEGEASCYDPFGYESCDPPTGHCSTFGNLFQGSLSRAPFVPLQGRQTSLVEYVPCGELEEPVVSSSFALGSFDQSISSAPPMVQEIKREIMVETNSLRFLL